MNEQQSTIFLDDWFTSFRTGSDYQYLKKRPLAYFCIEYALSDDLSTYAGGLGILARDFVKELSARVIPSVAVGLLYYHPYSFSSDRVNLLPTYKYTQKLRTVLDKDKKEVLIHIPIQDHIVFAKAWIFEEDSIPVYLLDTNISENNAQDRGITHQLYTTNKETRLKQEIVLGIGGFRLLEVLGIDPSIIHLNEGHSALLGLEFIHHEMQKHHIGFTEAIATGCRHVVFTNHTLVPAGNEVFSKELFTLLLEAYAQEIEVPVSEILSLGAVEDSASFSMTLFALHIAGKQNAVSALHAKKADQVWTDFTFEPVTNGIYIPLWDGVRDNDLTSAHESNKRALLNYIEEESGVAWRQDHLLLGWARRIVPYKRPLALFEEIRQLKAFVMDSKMPLRIVISGISPPGYTDAHEILLVIKEIINKELNGFAVYLPNYNNNIAYKLVTGTDVWLNTPVIGSEACGTSGMKAALNGSLPVSTKDGWVDEVDITQIGWQLENDRVTQSLMETLRENIMPMYFLDKPAWLKRQHKARAMITDQFSATRMLKDYIEKLYLPIISCT